MSDSDSSDVSSIDEFSSSTDASEQQDEGDIEIIRNLVKTMITIYDTYEQSQHGKVTGNRNPQKLSALKYSKLLSSESSSLSLHSPYILPIYEKFREQILETLEDQSWLLQKKQIVIWVGEDDPKIKSMNARLNLTDCFQRASIMRKKIQEKMNNSTDSFENNDLLGSPHFYLYTEFLYYLISLFRECLNKDHPDRELLDPIIEEYYELSGLDGIDDYPDASPQSQSFSHSAPPAPEKIGEAVSEVFSNKNVSDLMSKTFDKISKTSRGSKNSKNVMGEIFKDLGPVVSETVGALNQTMAGNNKGKKSKIPKPKKKA